MRSRGAAVATAWVALLATGAARAETVTSLEGDTRVLASPDSFAEPGAIVASFALTSARFDRDLRDAPGTLVLMTPGGMLVAEADADARHFAAWRVDAESGRPLRADAADGATCATGQEPACWRPGDPVPYSTEVADALGTSFAAMAGLGSGSAPPPNRDRFGLICASSIGFSELDRAACAETTYTAIPLVPLNVDPNDPPPPMQSSVLSPAQQALIGCGPYWGSDCASDGIDLRNANAGVLVQSWLGLDGTSGAGTVASQGGPVATRYGNGKLVMLPGSRAPGDPARSPPVNDCTSSGSYGLNADTLTQPFKGQLFRDEMAALSFNMLALLVASSQPPAGADPTGGDTPSQDPLSRAPGQCSFAQPQFCSQVRNLFALTAQWALTDDQPNRKELHWLWESGAEYRVIAVAGDVADYAGGRVHVLGLEHSRTREASLGVPIALFPPAGRTLAPDTRFAMPGSGTSAPDHGFAYLSAPEPGGAVLAVAAIGALAALARRRRDR